MEELKDHEIKAIKDIFLRRSEDEAHSQKWLIETMPFGMGFKE